MNSATAPTGRNGNFMDVPGSNSFQSPQTSASPSLPAGSRPPSTAAENASQAPMPGVSTISQHESRQSSASAPPANKAPVANMITSSREYEQLTKLVKDTSAETVRQCVRDNWMRCLQGSDFHSAFILNTIIHHASPKILESALNEFGPKFIMAGNRKLINHYTSKDLDAVADIMLARASPEFLDRALAQRLETISGRALVNALAKAERLGYDVRDIVQNDGERRQEQVTANGPAVKAAVMSAAAANLPQQPGQPAYHQNAQVRQFHQHTPQQLPSQPQYAAQQRYQGQPPREQAPEHRTFDFPDLSKRVPKGVTIPPGVATCNMCGRPCSSEGAVAHHKKKDACSVSNDPNYELKHNCVHCGGVFTNQSGLAYHQSNRVCGDFSEDMQAAMKGLIKSLGSQVYLAKPTPKFSTKRQSLGPAHQSSPSGVGSPSANYSAMASAQWDNQGAYENLPPHIKTAFDAEMAEAEAKYGGRMKDVIAQGLPSHVEELELSKLKNSLTTKQSTLRKRYGIGKKRTRRTKEQMEADRLRMIANGESHGAGAKRLSPSQEVSPRKRVPLDQMGGLSGASASAELNDPTLNMTPSQPRMPQPVPRPNFLGQAQSTPLGTQGDPMNVDESESSENDETDDESEQGSGAASGSGGQGTASA